MEKAHLVERLRGMERTALIVKADIEEDYNSRKRFNSRTERNLLRLKQLAEEIVDVKTLVESDGVEP